MKQLPAGLCDHLHFPDPYPHPLWMALAAVLLLLLLWFLWRRRARRVPPPVPAPPPLPAPAPAAVEAAIDDIRARYLDADRRRGCHQLSRVLREHFEAATGRRITTFTVGEIAAEVGDKALEAFFGLLGDLQFRRREPSRDDFEGICELAGTVVRNSPAGARR